MHTQAEQTISSLKFAMQLKGDFPAVSSKIERIMQIMHDPGSSDEKMATMVLGDYALSQNVLRLASSPAFAAFSPITTVSKAIYVLGTKCVGHLAMNLKLIDKLEQSADTLIARKELAKAVVAGAIARKIGVSTSGKDGESLAVATLIRSLGKLLVCFYLPSKFAEIEAGKPCSEIERANSCKVLGLSFEEVAKAIVNDWHLPAELKVSLGEPENTRDSHINWMHAVSVFSIQYVSAVAHGDDADALRALAAQHSGLVGVTAAALYEHAQTTIDQANSEEGHRHPAFWPNHGESQQITIKALQAGIAEIAAIEQGMKPAQILGMATEVLWHGLNCARFMLFLRNRPKGTFELVLGRGEGIADKVRKLSFPEAFSPNVIHFALSKNQPVYLRDATSPSIAKRIPGWLQNACPPARNIFLMPFSIGGLPAGLIYLAWDQARNELSPEELRHIEHLHSLVSNALNQATKSPWSHSH